MRNKFTQYQFDFGDMAIALVLWLCTLPLVALIIMPIFGSKVAVMTAFILFFITMAICWGICGKKVLKG